MKKLYYFIPFVLAFGALQGEEEVVVDSVSISQPGRYQMSTVAKGKENSSVDLFLLDTQTGTVWKSHNGTWGKGFKEWKLVVPSVEQ